MPLPSDPSMQAFDPGVAAAGYSTNLLSESATAPTAEPLIFVGYSHAHSENRYTIGMGDKVRDANDVRTADYRTPSQIMSLFDDQDRDDFLKMRNLLIAAGVVPPESDPYAVRNAFQSILGDVAEMTAQGINLSPMGYVKNLIRMNGIDPSKVGSGEDYGVLPEDQPFTGNKKTVSRSVDEITEGEAFVSLQQTLSQMLGRDPSDEDLRQFTYKMNALAAQNPSISTTITKYKNGEAVSSNTNTSGGFGSADIAQQAYEDAQDAPDYAKVQSGTTYFNAAMTALGAIGG